MACFKPQYAYVKESPNANGKFELTWNIREANLRKPPVSIPCGGCIGCKKEYSRIWAVRCMHEASLYDDNCFITLTYNDEHLPIDGKLKMVDVQLFLKRLRRRIAPCIGASCFWHEGQDVSHPLSSPRVDKYYKPFGVRYFYCGEFGGQGKRPHYHAILFNFDFPDREWVRTDGGELVQSSKMLQELWSDDDGKPLGFVQVGECNFESCAYVARYVLKKIDTMLPEEKYKYLKALSDGEGDGEFVRMSRRPGIGYGWIEKFMDDVYNQDFVLVRDGFKCRPPKYYDSKYALTNPERLGRLKVNRKEKLVNSDLSYATLKRREKYNILVARKMRRSYHGQCA